MNYKEIVEAWDKEHPWTPKGKLCVLCKHCGHRSKDDPNVGFINEARDALVFICDHPDNIIQNMVTGNMESGVACDTMRCSSTKCGGDGIFFKPATIQQMRERRETLEWKHCWPNDITDPEIPPCEMCASFVEPMCKYRGPNVADYAESNRSKICKGKYFAHKETEMSMRIKTLRE